MSRKRRRDRDKDRALLIWAWVVSCLLMVAAAVPIALVGVLPEAPQPSGDQTLAELNASAVESLRNGELRSGLSDLRRIRNKSENYLPARVNLIWALNLQGKYHDAAKEAEDLKAKSKCPQALNNMAEALLFQARKWGYADKLDEALEKVERSIEIDPNCSAAWIIKGNVLSEMGEAHWPQAFEAYDKALQIDANDVHALVGKGWLAIRSGDYETALRCHRNATALTSRDLDAWRIGICAEMKRDANSAPIATTNKALCFFQDSAALHNYRGLALYRQGKYQEALVSLEKATNYDPNSHCAWNNKALALAALGRTADAITSLDTALASKPDYAPALRNKALLTGADPAPRGKAPGSPTSSPAPKANRP